MKKYGLSTSSALLSKRRKGRFRPSATALAIVLYEMLYLVLISLPCTLNGVVLNSALSEGLQRRKRGF